MNIKPVQNNYSYNNKGIENKAAKEQNESKVEDKIEISEKAKLMNKKNLQSEKMASIKEKIENNFYNSDEVIKKVSQEIYKEIKEK